MTKNSKSKQIQDLLPKGVILSNPFGKILQKKKSIMKRAWVTFYYVHVDTSLELSINQLQFTVFLPKRVHFLGPLGAGYPEFPQINRKKEPGSSA